MHMLRILISEAQSNGVLNEQSLHHEANERIITRTDEPKMDVTA